MKKKNLAYIILAIPSLAAITATIMLAPVRQDETYHLFSDTKTCFGIPNFWNVLSNLPFLIIGIIGLAKWRVFRKPRLQYLLFFVSILLVAFGSAFYHLHPTAAALIWDRLPMTLSFMSLLSIIVSEYIHEKKGRLLLFPLLMIGLLGVVVWIVFDDLRLYAFVQFYPVLVIPLILFLFKSSTGSNKRYWHLLLFYGVAKLLEHFDREIHLVLNCVSGHTLKHLAVAMGLFVWLSDYLVSDESEENN